MKTILVFVITLIANLSFAQYPLNNGGTIINFSTLAERDAWIAAHSPNDSAKSARRALMAKENELCSEVIDDLRDEFKKQVEDGNMTVSQATTLFTVVRDTFLALECGWLREARMIANNTPTTAIFTAGRKTFLLTQIDAAIAKL